ncbi:MAG: phosphoadenylyl-sulfate reductase, partial [Xanthomonadales bacterium]|nr:phosphoadenylyl-sulfate reductase [Xanthomonadales bacterium]
MNLNAVETSRDNSSRIESWLATQDVDSRIDWALRHLPGPHVLSSSFGAQAAAMLHLLTQHQGDIPVVLIDTGYLFAETYRFADALRERLDLNLHVVRPQLSPAWLEARHGRLWEQGASGLERYNQLTKVEPMQRTLDELGAATWFAGLRRNQSASRAQTPLLEYRHGRWKVHPIADWSDHDVAQ